MALFKKKQMQPIPIAVVESPAYSIQSIERRVAILAEMEKKAEERIEKFEVSIQDIGNNTIEKLQEIRNELGEITAEYKNMREHFSSVVKALTLTAKQEDFEKTNRIIEQYDFADMITRKEFEKLL